MTVNEHVFMDGIGVGWCCVARRLHPDDVERLWTSAACRAAFSVELAGLVTRFAALKTQHRLHRLFLSSHTRESRTSPLCTSPHAFYVVRCGIALLSGMRCAAYRGCMNGKRWRSSVAADAINKRIGIGVAKYSKNGGEKAAANGISGRKATAA